MENKEKKKPIPEELNDDALENVSGGRNFRKEWERVKITGGDSSEADANTMSGSMLQ